MKTSIFLAIFIFAQSLSGQIVLPKNSMLTDFYDGYATINTNNRYALIDQNASPVIQHGIFDFISTPFETSVIVIKNGKVGIYDFINIAYLVAPEYDAITLPDRFGNVLLSTNAPKYYIYNILTQQYCVPDNSILSGARQQDVIRSKNWDTEAFIVANTNAPNLIRQFKYLTSSLGENQFLGYDINEQPQIYVYQNNSWSSIALNGYPIDECIMFDGIKYIKSEVMLPDGNFEFHLEAEEYGKIQILPLTRLTALFLSNNISGTSGNFNKNKFKEKKTNYIMTPVVHRDQYSYYKVQITANPEDYVREPRYRTMYGMTIKNGAFIPLNAEFHFNSLTKQYESIEGAKTHEIMQVKIYEHLGLFDLASNLAYAEEVENDTIKKGFIDGNGKWKIIFPEE